MGHDTDSYAALRHAIQDLIDQGLVDLGCPSVTTDPLPTHDTRAVPPPPGGVHLIEYSGDEIFMMGWDGEAPQPISLYADSDFSGYTQGQQVSRPFRLIPDDVPGQTSVSPVYLQHVPTMTPFILFSKEYGPVHRDVQIVMSSGRVAPPSPPPALLIDLLLVLMLEMRFREKMMRFCTNYAPPRPAFPFGAYWPHPAHIEMR